MQRGEEINTILVDLDGRLWWGDDLQPLPACTDCGSQTFDDWWVPDVEWLAYAKAEEHLCRPCFRLRGWRCVEVCAVDQRNSSGLVGIAVRNHLRAGQGEPDA